MGPHERASLSRRLASLRFRLRALTGLKGLLPLRREHGLTRRQWTVIEAQLHSAHARLCRRLERAERAFGEGPGLRRWRELHWVVGELELELAKAYVLFDTYMDVLTQRLSPELGPLLRGCDALAQDALAIEHPALRLVERPVVFCDRGFGAAIMREGVRLPDGSQNPLALIQIPYARLREKHNLTSLYHEAGHEALVRLGLRRPLAQATHEALVRFGAPRLLAELFANWMGELGPDFWTFGCTGVAQPGTLREILALPPKDVFRVPASDPHPPPYLRALVSFEWARRALGQGPWEAWEEEWRALYPLEEAPADVAPLLRAAEALLPEVARVLLRARFRSLGGRRLPELFDVPGQVALPAHATRTPPPGRPGAQLGYWRLLRESGRHDEQSLDDAMTAWLQGHGQNPDVTSTRRMEMAHA